MRICTPGVERPWHGVMAGLGCMNDMSRARTLVTEALMLVRPFRFVAPALAALGLIGLRLVSPISGPAAPPCSNTVEDGRVVFRHYL